jgi:hypothetical protein
LSLTNFSLVFSAKSKVKKEIKGEKHESDVAKTPYDLRKNTATISNHLDRKLKQESAKETKKVRPYRSKKIGMGGVITYVLFFCIFFFLIGVCFFVPPFFPFFFLITFVF